MKKNLNLLRSTLFRSLLLSSVAVSLGSCNIYQPLGAPNSDATYVEEALACLASRSYDCALDNYNRISDATLKAEKLCVGNLAKSGLGLSTVLNTVAGSSSNAFLGALATGLLPWTSDKETGAKDAVTACNSYGNLATGQKQAMLRILAYMTDCAIRIAKTDRLAATSEVSESCNADTQREGNGSLTSSDIAQTHGANLSATNPGMCKYDVTTCLTDLSAVATLQSQLGTGQANITQNIGNLDASLLSTGTGTAIARQSIADSL